MRNKSLEFLVVICTVVGIWFPIGNMLACNKERASTDISSSRPGASVPRVVFTNVPKSSEKGGPDSRGEITGRVEGLATPEHCKVVLYTHTDAWYVQPLVSDPLTEIQSDGTWSNWTHLGRRYAALVVKSGFQPPAKTQTLPPVGEQVLAVGQTPGT